MLYIHHTACISPQQSFGDLSLETLHESVNNQLLAREPVYEGIPPGLLRRMGKAVKMGVGAALSLLAKQPIPTGILIGTANGGMEDCIKFLNQIIEYDEGILAPGNFVQSTTNAIASQLGLLNRNHAYNITHVHRGLAFENALIDAMMLTEEHPDGTFLLGAVDEISTYNFNIDFLDGWFKKTPVSNLHLYDTDSDGSLAGEGAVMFLVNGNPQAAMACVKSVQFLHSDDEEEVAAAFQDFLNKEVNTPIDWMISGENGDRRVSHFYTRCASMLAPGTGVCRFKHMTGEFSTASAIGLWLACYMLQKQVIPAHMIKKKADPSRIGNIVIYNNHKLHQHSFMLIGN